MAKSKSYRKPNISRDTLERARAELKGGVAPAENAAVAASSTTVAKPKANRPAIQTANRRIPSAEELREEYKYVLKELRSLLILAGVLFLFIIVTALILPPAV